MRSTATTGTAVTTGSIGKIPPSRVTRRIVMIVSEERLDTIETNVTITPVVLIAHNATTDAVVILDNYGTYGKNDPAVAAMMIDRVNAADPDSVTLVSL
jgi:hypothetical protein